MMDKYHWTSHTSILRSFITFVMFNQAPLKVSGNPCIKRVICTTEYVAKVSGHIPILKVSSKNTSKKGLSIDKIGYICKFSTNYIDL